MAYENNRFAVPKLDTNNYARWKKKTQMLLMKEGLWETVESEPPSVPDVGWNRRDQQALATIGLLLEDTHLVEIDQCSSAREAWTTLKNIHESTSWGTQLHLIRNLFGTKYTPGKPMREHINLVMELSTKLRDAGESLSDKLMAAALLGSLPSEYNSLITAIEGRRSEDVSLTFIAEKMVEESKRLNQELEGAEAREITQALYTHQIRDIQNTEPKHNRQQNNFSKHTCFYCHKVGHVRRDCRLLRAHNYHGNTHSPEQTSSIYTPRELTQGDRSLLSQIQEPCMSNIPEGPMRGKAMTSAHGELKKDGWILDSGASQHMSPLRSFFEELEVFPESTRILTANGSSEEAIGKGSGKIFPAGNETGVELREVLFVPGLETGLLSIRSFCHSGYVTRFDREGCSVKNGSCTVMEGENIHNLYRLKEITRKPDERTLLCAHEWHIRLGHRNLEDIRAIADRKLSSDIVMSDCTHSDHCTICVRAKGVQEPFPGPSELKTQRPGQLLHLDLCGPFETVSMGGNRYLLTVVDDFSRYLVIRMLKYKSQAAESIIDVINMCTNQHGCPQIVRTDGGGEFVNGHLSDFFRSQGITHQLTVPHTPQQNGVAERANRTIVEMMRCQLLNYETDKRLWGESAAYSAEIINRVPHSARYSTPYHIWHGKVPDLSKFQEFGSTCFYYQTKHGRKKLEPTYHEGVLVGMDPVTKGYRIWDCFHDQILVTV